MKTTIFLASFFCAQSLLYAQADGPFNGQSFSTTAISGNTQSWTNTSNVASSDDVYASFGNIPGGVGSYSDYLVVTGFGFNIPSGVTVLGISVDVERSDPNNRTSDYSIRIVKGGIIGAAERSTGIAYPASDSYQTYGSSGDLWGESWSYKEIDNNNFGVAIAAQRNATGGQTAGRIDNIRVTVYYAFITLPIKLVSFTAKKSENHVTLDWSTEAESGIRSFQVERSADGIQFQSIQSVTAMNTGRASYQFTDEHPAKGPSLYRLRIKEDLGEKFSTTLPIFFSEQKEVLLTPSVCTQGQVLSINNDRNEELSISLYTAYGELAAKISTNNSRVKIPATTDKKGLFYYRVYNALGVETGSGKLVVY